MFASTGLLSKNLRTPIFRLSKRYGLYEKHRGRSYVSFQSYSFYVSCSLMRIIYPWRGVVPRLSSFDHCSVITNIPFDLGNSKADRVILLGRPGQYCTINAITTFSSARCEPSRFANAYMHAKSIASTKDAARKSSSKHTHLILQSSTPKETIHRAYSF